MGQQPSKGYARFDEIIRERERVFALLDTLRNPAADEKTAGLPGGPGSHQARYEAAINYLEQLWAEQQALEAHLSRWLGTCGLGWVGMWMLSPAVGRRPGCR